jgi:hypothetical protein
MTGSYAERAEHAEPNWLSACSAVSALIAVSGTIERRLLDDEKQTQNTRNAPSRTALLRVLRVLR